jgi:hypothetical protein
MTMNSPESLLQLHELASSSKTKEEAVHLAELIREIGLKCIGFNGVCLNRKNGGCSSFSQDFGRYHGRSIAWVNSGLVYQLILPVHWRRNLVGM